jgi:hypothetical protein
LKAALRGERYAMIAGTSLSRGSLHVVLDILRAEKDLAGELGLDERGSRPHLTNALVDLLRRLDNNKKIGQ